MYSNTDPAIDTNRGNFDGGKPRTTTDHQPREGFNSNSGNSDPVASYGAGSGSDATDLANTGLGGYGTSNKFGGARGANESGSTKMPGAFEGSSGPQLASSGDERREGFGDSGVGAGGDPTSPYGTGPGAGMSDSANTRSGGYGVSAKGGQMFDQSGTQSEGEGTSLSSQVQDAQAKGTKVFDDYEGGQKGGAPGQKVTGASFVDQATGYAEQFAASLTGDESMKK